MLKFRKIPDGSKKFREKLLRKIPAKVSKNFKRQNILKRSKFQEILRKFRSNLFWKVKTQLKNVKVLGNSWWFKKFCKSLTKWSKNSKIKVLAKAEDSENFWRRIKSFKKFQGSFFREVKKYLRKMSKLREIPMVQKVSRKSLKKFQQKFRKTKVLEKVKNSEKIKVSSNSKKVSNNSSF